MTVFLFLYYSMSFVYRFILEGRDKINFEIVAAYCKNYGELIPLSFVLGFYVSIVMTRWWNQYMVIPWPDGIAVYVSATIHGNDERGRLMRRTIVRYVCVCLTIVLTNISPRVKKRFPTLEHLVDAGLLLENELSIIQSLNAKFPKASKHWLPIVWASSIVTRARKEGRIRDDFAVKTLIDELNIFRGNCGRLIHYDMISVPLVYTQVVTLAVYMYFMTAVMGRQWTGTTTVFVNGTEPFTDYSGKTDTSIDQYFPVFTTLEFFFYMGWLKVAETLINPFGEDDDDFEVNWIVDRNLQASRRKKFITNVYQRLIFISFRSAILSSTRCITNILNLSAISTGTRYSPSNCLTQLLLNPSEKNIPSRRQLVFNSQLPNRNFNHHL